MVFYQLRCFWGCERLMLVGTDRLEQKIEGLLDLYQRLRRENEILREKERLWLGERAYFIKKHEHALVRLTSVVDRLRVLEQEF